MSKNIMQQDSLDVFHETNLSKTLPKTHTSKIVHILTSPKHYKLRYIIKSKFSLYGRNSFQLEGNITMYTEIISPVQESNYC